MGVSQRHRMRSTDLNWRELDDEAIILDLKQHSYLSLNSSGLTLWRMLEAGATSDELAERLVEEHEVSRELADRDVAAFLQMLGERGLLE